MNVLWNGAEQKIALAPMGLVRRGLTWFGRALLALVETPGGAHTSTAIILFG